MAWCVIKPMDNVAFTMHVSWTLSLSRWRYHQQLCSLWVCRAYILSPLCLQYEIFRCPLVHQLAKILLLVNRMGLSHSNLFIEVSLGTCWAWAGNISLSSFGEAHGENLQLSMFTSQYAGCPRRKGQYSRRSQYQLKKEVYMYVCPVPNSDLY
jgi:hypothetical protein